MIKKQLTMANGRDKAKEKNIKNSIRELNLEKIAIIFQIKGHRFYWLEKRM